MQYRYRRFYYNGPIDMSERTVKVWIPKHRSIVSDRAALESNIRYAVWRWDGRNRVSIEFTGFEGDR
jgi:hypothetical protein